MDADGWLKIVEKEL
jgi:hypothetical protein